MEQKYTPWLLSKEEQTFLKLLVHNCSVYEMETFLGIKKPELDVLDRQIRKKLNTQTSYETIVKAFDLKLIDEYDYVDEIVKEIAVKTTSKIKEYQRVQKENEASVIEDMLKEMVKVSEEQLQIQKREQLDMVLFSAMEVNYIRLSFEGNTIGDIAEKLRIREEKIIGLEKSVFDKLQVNCWYNAYRRAFELKLLKRTRPYQYLREFKKTVTTIINNSNSLKAEKIEEEKIYRRLVALYCAIEHKMLHRNYPKSNGMFVSKAS